MNDCFICNKHKDLSPCGGIILEKGGLVLSHFPDSPTERATKGHLLIEPWRHITDLSEMNDAEASALGNLIRNGVDGIKKLGAEHVYLFRINDMVAHLHIHLVPRYPGTPKEFWGRKIMDWPERNAIGELEIQSVAHKLKEWAKS